MKSKTPCPWCKESIIRVLSKGLTPEVEGLMPGHQVECTNCGARGPSGYIDTSNAVGAWEGLDMAFAPRSET
jgi:hypothetical protein